MLVQHDLTPHHYAVLLTLDSVGATSQQQLSRLVGVDPRNAVPLLDSLEARRLIERTPDPVDRRRHSVSLTATGRATLKELRNTADEVEHNMLRTSAAPIAFTSTSCSPSSSLL
ncbi:MAG: MarR family winged helix-turn-helix transcriptional regulator [Nocardioidaceae bacterium]